MGALKVECIGKKINTKKLCKLVYAALGQKDKLSAELAFVNADEILALNTSHRGIAQVTDVLSFPSLDGIKGKVLTRDEYPYETEHGRLHIGSIAICEQRAAEQAAEYGHTTEREIIYLVLHGLLHLFGYDHIDEKDKSEMRALEKQIIGELYTEEKE